MKYLLTGLRAAILLFTSSTIIQAEVNMVKTTDEMEPLFKVVGTGTFISSPKAGTGVVAGSYYTEREGARLMSIHSFVTRSDTADVACQRFSDDNGASWGPSLEKPTKFADPKGTGRRHLRGGYVDPRTGNFIFLWIQGVLPTDNPLEGMRHWTLHYSISRDGGRTEIFNRQVIHEGEGYDSVHHLPGVTEGKNCVMIGDLTCRPITRADGAVLVPVQSSPVGAKGIYSPPAGALTFTDCMLLIGHWKKDGDISWTASERIAGDPGLSVRGFIEPTIAELSDGSILMVMRGSNGDGQPTLPGYRWASRSRDGGQTWSKPVPWVYDDGANFHSPSSCSQLVPYSDGRLFWVGNISPANTVGNGPRYPLVIGEVDCKTGLLIRRSVTVVDDRRQDESKDLTLSNFLVREDRETKELILHLSRFFPHDQISGSVRDWTADARLYRIAVKAVK